MVPHADLGALPFAALHDGECSLAQRLELAFAPSAHVALRGLRLPPAPSAGRWLLGESSRLPHAAGEARMVASLFPLADTFVGRDATLGAVARARGRRRRHSPRVPCAVPLGQSHVLGASSADGALTVEATEGLSLKPCTVVLSACETALAEQGTGDEMVGLVRAFLAAGAARVLASLWPVDDEITSQFMSHFHVGLGGGMTPAASLRHAQIELMRQHAHPFHWAAFILYGRW